jgi:enoyl-CoA hydratase/carnithine racemase
MAEANPITFPSDSDTPRVRVTVTDGIADVVLSRPEKRNALDGAMFLGIAEAGAAVAGDPRVRAVVVSGEGAAFCAGLDFGSFQQMAGGGGDGGAEGSPSRRDPDRITHLGQQVAWVWQEVPVPVIAAVHGHALGGGLQIALGADIRIVHPDTQLSVREVYWGLVPDMTGTLILSRLLRPDIAKELTFTARILSGTEAVTLGLCTSLSEDPRRDALAMAAEIARLSPDAVRGSKELFNQILHAGAAQAFSEERRVIGSLIGSGNQVEAVMAHFEKRPPAFNDPT